MCGKSIAGAGDAGVANGVADGVGGEVKVENGVGVEVEFKVKSVG